MNADDLLSFAIPAIVVVGSLLVRMARGGKARRVTSGAPQPAAPPASAPRAALGTETQQRVQRISAMLAQRGIATPASLQALVQMAAPDSPPPPAPVIHRAVAARAPMPPPPPAQAVSPAAPLPPLAPLDVAPIDLIPGISALPRPRARSPIVAALRDPLGVRNGMILAEILNAPVALR